MSGLTPDPKTHTEAVEFLSPTFLLGPNGAAYMYTMALQFDALDDAASYAVRERYPATCSDDALQYLQQDRQIDRGPNEGRPSFEARLRQWLDLWRTAGGAPAVLRALDSYFLPSTVEIETVNDTTADNLTAWDVNTSDPPDHYLESPGNWDWDGMPTPGRSWVIIFNGPWAQTPKWGDGHKWGDGTCWGFNGTVDVAVTLRNLVAKWKSGGCSVPWIIISFSNAATWFSHSFALPSAGLPDGTWGNWGTVTVDGSGRRVYTPSRTSTAIYISGVP